jgi:hypothetical protein
VQKLFIFINSHLCILSLSCWAAVVLLRKSLPIPTTSRMFAALSYTNFRVLGLILRSLVNFQLILVQSDKHEPSFSSLQMVNHFSKQNLLKKLSFLHLIYLASLKKLDVRSCVDSYLNPLFCSTGLFVCFCAGTMLFLLLLLCNIV